MFLREQKPCTQLKTPKFVPFSSLKTELRWLQEASVTLCGVTECAVHSAHAVCSEPRLHCLWVMRHRGVLPETPDSLHVWFQVHFFGHMMPNSLSPPHTVYNNPPWGHDPQFNKLGCSPHHLLMVHHPCQVPLDGKTWWILWIWALTTDHHSSVALCAWHGASPMRCDSGPWSQGYQAHNIVVQCHSCLHQA